MKKAVVLLSGGLDSATCLAIARDQGYECHTIAFDYGQRTRSELDAAVQVSGALGALSHRVIELGMGNIGGSALTDHSIDVPEDGGAGIPVTYVPARNTVFLSLALGLAEVVDAQAIFIGVNAVDYSGYPDCRPAFIEAFQSMANLATKAGVEGRPMQIETPLMHLSKAQIIQQGVALGLDYGLTVSCYQADENGNACGKCDSCRLRSQGFEDALVKDPTNYQ
ncbi:7-cyano-7-deazaguanine synthase [Alcanivorax sp. HI0083]|uniref:7-cyano-7-deazaguanine synthase QueC n=2 Tax=Alcanivorax TaxID=59753 RepID=UPI0007B8B6D8|nr:MULTISPECIES: 7-cyano-7-deazaguanine synthase QueC [unclassified Alcanivorax]KZY32009.1 7-cyano-7-deazaguanine synthase [Alcanivorax sp. HI0044]KZZ29340.1 7-cyano-7-deazaguanine synthase [Alcanivorax sp. HI0083]PHR67762.1 MAG: 7-cyano-7-deazaguanine synthase QueC [Alcanivorax sp.]